MALHHELMHTGMPPGQARLLGTQPQTTIAAAGTTQATAAPLTSNSLILSGGSGGWLLPGGGGPWRVIQVVTAGNLYPAVGGTINALAANAPLAVTAGQRLLLVPSSGTNWTAIVSA